MASVPQRTSSSADEEEQLAEHVGGSSGSCMIWFQQLPSSA
jgi:hypothetical protein